MEISLFKFLKNISSFNLLKFKKYDLDLMVCKTLALLWFMIMKWEFLFGSSINLSRELLASIERSSIVLIIHTLFWPISSFVWKNVWIFDISSL